MNIPYHKQITDYYCGPASLQMVLEYFGIHTSQQKLAEHLNTTPDNGTDHSDLIRVAREHGFYCYVNQESTLEEVRHFLAQKLPVIVNFMEPKDNDPHYAVVIDQQDENIILHDPWNGKEFALLDKWFLDHWYDVENNAKQWIMVLSQNDFGLGKQFIPIRNDE